jgi:hypothetical protein
MDDAVVITAASPFEGVPAEYAYVEMQCGRRNVDWTMWGQKLLGGPGGKYYDLLAVKLKDGTVREFYFDISSFYGKS